MFLKAPRPNNIGKIKAVFTFLCCLSKPPLTILSTEAKSVNLPFVTDAAGGRQ